MKKISSNCVVFLFLCVFLCLAFSFHAFAETPSNTEQESYSINPNGMTVETRFPAPKGFERKSYDDPYTDYLRHYPMLPDGTPVMLYTGTPKLRQNDHIGVLDMDIGRMDLIRSAAAAQRLRAEYLYKAGQYEGINYHFSNGQELSWEKWRAGWRVQFEGEKTTLVQTNVKNSSHENFKYYLGTVFKYSGIRSMMLDSRRVDTAKMRPGDILASPGHAIIILDIVENNEGQKKVLLAQSYGVAQQIEVLKNPESDSPWYNAKDLEFCPFKTPGWYFDCPEAELYRLP